MKILLTIILLSLIVIIFYKQTKCEQFLSSSSASGLNRLDAIIYINLDHRKDRKKQIEGELERMGVDKNKIIRFPAVYEKMNGHLGCTKSHIGVMKLIQNSNFNNALILEDDFKFVLSKDETNKKIDHFLDKFGNDWDAVHLSRSYWNKDRDVDEHICKIKSAMTSSGYMVNNNNNFYENLLDDFKGSEEKLTKNLEKWLKENPGKKKYEDSAALNQHWGGLQSRSKWYMFEPVLGEQGGSASTIMGSPDNNKTNYSEHFSNNNQKIVLITQYYEPKNEVRLGEIRTCLMKNLENKYIDIIYLYVEKDYTFLRKYNNNNNNKLVIKKNNKRLTFKTTFDFTNTLSDKNYYILCNSDIYFDNTIERVKQMNFDNLFLAQLRFEIADNNINKNIFYSQDTWIWKGNNKIQFFEYHDDGVELGIGGCDNLIAYLAKKSGYKIKNYCEFIKTFHLHKENIREWRINPKKYTKYMLDVTCEEYKK